VKQRHQDSNYREILRVAIPASSEAVFQTSFGFIDQIIVGSLGAVAVAAVGLSNNLAFILTLLYAGIGTGSGAFIAQAYGRRDMDEVSKIAALGQTATALLGVCSALPLVLFSVPILHGLGAQEDVVRTASGYLQFFAASVPMNVMSSVTTATFRAMSDSRTPMGVTIGAVVLNTLLALLLVLGVGGFPRLGVTGAGLATLTSQTLRCLTLLAFLYSRKPGLHWHWPSGHALRRIGFPLFQVTCPVAISEMLWGTSTFIYTIVFTRIGTDALASSQIVTTIESIFIVAATGLAPAAVATTGQALGNNAKRNAVEQAGRVLRAGLIAGFVFTAALTAAAFLLPVFYPRIDNAVLTLAFWGVIVTALVQPAKVVNSIFGTGILPSGGDTPFVLLSHTISSYALGLPVAALTAIVLKLGALSVFGSRALEEVFKAVMLFFRYRTGSWQRRLTT
jgi:putative MATE family efflux protein